VLEEHEHVHPAQINQVDVDEGAGDDAFGLRGQELAPHRSAAAWSWINARCQGRPTGESSSRSM
jgi:hypothetical protein